MTEEPLNQLFQFLRSSFRAVGDAHRTNPRRHTSIHARLSWAQGQKRQTVRARLVDISRAGAALITAVGPPLKAHVRLRLVGQEATPWIEASVLGVEPESPSRHKVRLQFTEPCPTYFLRVAVLAPLATDEDAADHGPTTDEPLDLTLRPSSPTSSGSIA